jgi:hypothetical protein
MEDDMCYTKHSYSFADQKRINYIKDKKEMQSLEQSKDTMEDESMSDEEKSKKRKLKTKKIKEPITENEKKKIKK